LQLTGGQPWSIVEDLIQDGVDGIGGEVVELPVEHPHPWLIDLSGAEPLPHPT
jgi:hypothetical protein